MCFKFSSKHCQRWSRCNVIREAVSQYGPAEANDRSRIVTWRDGRTVTGWKLTTEVDCETTCQQRCSDDHMLRWVREERSRHLRPPVCGLLTHLRKHNTACPFKQSFCSHKHTATTTIRQTLIQLLLHTDYVCFYIVAKGAIDWTDSRQLPRWPSSPSSTVVGGASNAHKFELLFVPEHVTSENW